MAELRKPDMAAVLDRTHLRVNFDTFLLPIYEAGSNAIYAMMDRFDPRDIAQSGKLIFDFHTGSTEKDFSATVTDNASGLDEINYLAFRTPFTGHRIKRGGRALAGLSDLRFSTRSAIIRNI